MIAKAITPGLSAVGRRAADVPSNAGLMTCRNDTSRELPVVESTAPSYCEPHREQLQSVERERHIMYALRASPSASQHGRADYKSTLTLMKIFRGGAKLLFRPCR